MAAKKIEINLNDAKSIKNAIKELEKYRDSLQYKASLLAEKLAEKGVEIAKVQVVSLDAVFTGELMDSIHSEFVSSVKDGAIFAIIADSKHAIFTEFGTGTRGQASPYPYPFPEGTSWEYVSGTHYVTLDRPFGKYPAGTYGWFYYKDGHLYFTEGMPSRPFMYNTSLEIVRQQEKLIKTFAKEIFK